MEHDRTQSEYRSIYESSDHIRDSASSQQVRLGRGRSVFLHLLLVAFALAIIWQASQEQLVRGSYWAELAEKQHLTTLTLPAPRGTILDDMGEPVAISREQVRLTIAPNQIRSATSVRNDRDSLINGLSALGVSRSVLSRVRDSSRSYVAVPGLFLPSEASRVMAMRGVRADWTMERLVSGPTSIRRLVGALDADGIARSGMEMSFDSILTGKQGERRALKDRRGRGWDSPVGWRKNATPGNSVRLTINTRLQEIVERELMLAIERTGASGGDLVVMDPSDGAILALAGARNKGIAASVTPLTQPYQPGSVLKPFFVARLLDEKKTRSGEMINTENGRWVQGSRVITDEHKAPMMSVFDIVRWSSNIGTVKLVVDRMSPESEYEMLRDYGFGVPSGVPYPSESRGILPNVERWSKLTAASLAIGYELAVTPVQLATAYAAIANGGELLEPALVREIRDADGSQVFRHSKRVIRRVTSESSAATVREMLKAVVDSGTGKAAGLAAFEVGGKSGTARRVVDGRYSQRNYDATFAGMFPMSDPQVVVVARLIDPTSQIFGGIVAAPMVREVLKGALAARDAALDRSVLARVARNATVSDNQSVSAIGDNGKQDDDITDSDRSISAGANMFEPAPARVVVSLPYERNVSEVVPTALRPIPAVHGLPLRQALNTLHSAGFKVRVVQGGVDGRTTPAAGRMTAPGTLVLLEFGR